MKKISIKAVILGWLAVSISFAVLVYLAGKVIVMTGTSPDHVGDVLNNNKMTPIGMAAVLGMCMVFGGYAGATVVRRDEIINGAAASLLIVAIDFKDFIFKKDVGVVHTVVGIFLSVACCTLGGYLRYRAVKKTISTEGEQSSAPTFGMHAALSQREKEGSEV